MLPAKNRLPGYRIPDVLKRGIRTRKGLVSIIALFSSDNQRPGNSLYSIIVPVRLSKKAVERNRTRRLLREAVHHHLDHLKPGYEIIIMANQLLKEEKLQDIEPVIVESLNHAHLIVSNKDNS